MSIGRYDLFRSPLAGVSRPQRAYRLVVIIVALAALALVASAGPAIAHNELVSSDPADGGSPTTAPTRILLTFDQPVQDGFNTITVTGPGDTRWTSGEATASGNTVSIALTPLGPAGDYLIGYRVVSADGHPMTGTLRFRLTQPGPGAATAPTATAAAQEPTSTPAAQQPAGTTAPAASTAATGGDTPVWPWALGAIVLLAAAALLGLRLARRDRT